LNEEQKNQIFNIQDELVVIPDEHEPFNNRRSPNPTPLIPQIQRPLSDQYNIYDNKHTDETPKVTHVNQDEPYLKV